MCRLDERRGEGGGKEEGKEELCLFRRLEGWFWGEGIANAVLGTEEDDGDDDNDKGGGVEGSGDGDDQGGETTTTIAKTTRLENDSAALNALLLGISTDESTGRRRGCGGLRPVLRRVFRRIVDGPNVPKTAETSLLLSILDVCGVRYVFAEESKANDTSLSAD